MANIKSRRQSLTDLYAVRQNTVRKGVGAVARGPPFNGAASGFRRNFRAVYGHNGRHACGFIRLPRRRIADGLGRPCRSHPLRQVYRRWYATARAECGGVGRCGGEQHGDYY